MLGREDHALLSRQYYLQFLHFTTLLCGAKAKFIFQTATLHRVTIFPFLTKKEKSFPNMLKTSLKNGTMYSLLLSLLKPSALFK